MKVGITQRDGGLVVTVEGELGSAEACDRFAELYNAARAMVFPLPEAEEEATAPKPGGDRGWKTVKPGTNADRILQLLQQGFTSLEAIADELDLTTGVTARLVGQLIKYGLWTGARPT